MHEAANVEKRLMPLPKLVEEDTAWAKQLIAKSEKYLDTSIKHHTHNAERTLYYAKPDHRFELNELLDEIIRQCRPVQTVYHDEPDHGDVKHGVHGLYKGLWPGRILLSPYLKDAESIKFRKTFMVFGVAFIVVQVCIVAALVVSAIQEALDAVPGGMPLNAFYVNGEAFDRLGYNGYCRDEGQHRPPGYFIAINKLEGSALLGTKAALWKQMTSVHSGMLRTDLLVDSKPRGTRSCARGCADNAHCIGFAVDPDLCNIYLDQQSAVPEGWDTLSSIHRQSGRDIAEHQHDNWAIVTTDHSMGATCYVKVEQGHEPENYVGCFVYFCHIIAIIKLVVVSVYMTFKGHFHAYQ